MAGRQHRQGGKIRGTHTTLINTAATLVDEIINFKEVIGVSPGFIKPGEGNAGGVRRVKIIDTDGGLLLIVRENGGVQELRVFSRDIQKTKLAIARFARNSGMHINFGNQKKSCLSVD